MYLALHHGRPTVILDVAPPPSLGHLEVLGKSLLTEEFSCVVVRVCHEILDTNGLCISFEPIHEARSIAVYLEIFLDGKEHDLSKLLLREGPKNAATNDSGLEGDQLRIFRIDNFFCCRLLFDYHSFVLPIHDQSYNIIFWHSRELLRDDIFQINEIPHGSQRLVILNHHEFDFALILLALNLLVSLDIALICCSF